MMRRALHVDDIRAGRVSIDARGRIVMPGARRRRKPTGKKGAAIIARELAYSRWAPIDRVIISLVAEGIRTASETNQRGQWRTYRRKRDQQERLFVELQRLRVRPKLPVVVTLERVAERNVDAHAEWHKWVVDEIARWLGVDDASPFVTWKFAQTATRKRGSWAVRITVTNLGDDPYIAPAQGRTACDSNSSITFVSAPRRSVGDSSQSPFDASAGEIASDTTVSK